MSQTAPCSKSTAPPRSDKLCRPPATDGDRRNLEAWWPTTHRCRDVPRRLRSGGRAEYASCSRADVAGRGPLWSATPSCGAVDRARAPHIPALAQGGGVAAGAAAGNATSAHALALPRRLPLTRGYQRQAAQNDRAGSHNSNARTEVDARNRVGRIPASRESALRTQPHPDAVRAPERSPFVPQPPDDSAASARHRGVRRAPVRRLPPLASIDLDGARPGSGTAAVSNARALSSWEAGRCGAPRGAGRERQ
jgi:hypothetical protein